MKGGGEEGWKGGRKSFVLKMEERAEPAKSFANQAKENHFLGNNRPLRGDFIKFCNRRYNETPFPHVLWNL